MRAARSSSVVLASTLSDSASKLCGVIEAVGGFLAILLVVFFVAGRVTGRLQQPLTILICLGPAVVLLIIGLVAPGDPARSIIEPAAGEQTV